MLAQLIAGTTSSTFVHCGAGQGAAHFCKNRAGSIASGVTSEMLKHMRRIYKKVPCRNVGAPVDGGLRNTVYQFPVSRDISSEVDEMEGLLVNSFGRCRRNFWTR